MDQKAPIITPPPDSKMLLAPLYHLELVKDRDLPYDGNAKTTEAAAQVLHTLLDRSVTEQMAVLYLNTRAEIVGAEKVGLGSIEAVQTNPTEIFRGAITMAVPEILLCHNHPSGEVEPSMPDVMFTFNILTVASMLGLRIRDHIIVGPSGKHFSIRENMSKLEPKLREAEDRALGGKLKEIKAHILDVLKSKGLAPEGSDIQIDSPFDSNPFSPPKKPGGNSQANENTDLESSLSYLLLTR
jgi:DNA repair protein RadC